MATGRVILAWAFAVAWPFGAAVAVALAVAWAEFRKFIDIELETDVDIPITDLISDVSATFSLTFAAAVTVAFAVASAVAFTFAMAQALLAFGLGAWFRALPKKANGWRYLAIFAFPCFCWLPVTITLDTLLAFHFHMSPAAIAFGWLAITLVVTALWRRGRTLENRARNPLRDILTFDTSRR